MTLSMITRYDPAVAPDPAAWAALDEAEATTLVERHHRSSRCDHPPATNRRVHASIHVIVENQIALGDELPVAATVRRLMAEGLTRHEAVHAVGSVLAGRIYEMLKHGEPSDPNAKYHQELAELTAESWRQSGIDPDDLEVDWAPEEDALADDDDLEDEDLDDDLADEGPGEDAQPLEGDDEELVELDDIIAALDAVPPRFPAAAIRAAEAARGRINERLLQVLADTHRAARAGEIEPGNAHIFAMLLLAEFEDPRAFDAIAELFSLPERLLDSLVGDFLTEDLGRVLASVCEGHLERLAALVEDQRRDQYVRCAALSAVAALVQRRVLSHAQAADYLRHLMRGGLEAEPSAVWDEAGNLVLDLYVEDLFDEVRAAIREGLIGRYMMGPSDVAQAARAGRETALAEFDSNPHYRPVRDVVAETSWWSCFRDDGDEADEDGEALERCSDPDCAEHAPPLATVRRDEPKVGRNDPCPCGSGKKYKKCCL
jgi:hypothetical protein